MTSPAYQHYNITLVRDDINHSLSFLFTCKVDPEGHPPQRRGREKTSAGTGNLIATNRACDARHKQGAAPISSDPPPLPYSEANHRALIAMRCAVNQHPFAAVEDELYQAEVAMLHPKTVLPSAATVSCDCQRLYISLATYVANYFFVSIESTPLVSNISCMKQALNTAVHLVLDGWTAPIVASYLGVVVVWCIDGQIHCAVLDFIR